MFLTLASGSAQFLMPQPYNLSDHVATIASSSCSCLTEVDLSIGLLYLTFLITLQPLSYVIIQVLLQLLCHIQSRSHRSFNLPT